MSNVNTLGSFGDTSGSSLMFRNRIINGGCLVAQRGSTALVNNTATYGGADRFLVAPFFTTSSGTIQKAAFSSATTGYGQFATITSTGTGNVVIAQRIESFSVLDLNGKTVTFSGIAYQNTGSAVTTTISIRKANGVDNFAGTTLVGSISTITLASGIETPFSLTLPLGGSDATNGLSVEVNFTGLGALTSKNFGVANVQLESGTSATPFEQRPIGVELDLCQRYYQVISWGLFNWSATSRGVGNQCFFPLYWKRMRAAPAPTISGSFGYTRSGASGSITINLQNQDESGGRLFTGDVGAPWVAVEISTPAAAAVALSAEL